MPPRKSIGARKKIVKTPPSSTRRKAAQNIAAAVAEENPNLENPNSENPSEENPNLENPNLENPIEEIDLTTADESSPEDTTKEETGDVATNVTPSRSVTNANIGDVPAEVSPSRKTKKPSLKGVSSSSSVPKPSSVMKEVICDVPTNVTPSNAEHKSLEEGISSSSVLEPCSVTKEETGDTLKVQQLRTTKKIVRKVTKKVPVRVVKKNQEPSGVVDEKSIEAVEEEKSSEAAEEEKSNEAVKEEKSDEAVEEENQDPGNGQAQPKEKKVRKVKKVVVVKKIVKKLKVEEKEKVAEVETLKASEKEDNLNEATKNEDNNSSGELMGLTECQKRRKTEIFVGGLKKDAKEEDLREVFGKAGEIVNVRMMIDSKTGRNKGYAFLRFATPAQAKKAITELSKAEVCGKQCAASALEGNDTLYLGNIDKKWKKEDLAKILKDIGVDRIDSLTLMPDPNKPGCNRGFAFLDFETNREAQAALKKLQNRDTFVDGRALKVAWAETYNEPDEEELEKVKAVFVEGVPKSWDESKLRECFEKYGDVGKIALSRKMLSTKRNDYAFVNFSTREAAVSCVELFDKDSSSIGSQANLKVSIAKPMKKGKKIKGTTKVTEKDSSKSKPVPVQQQSSRSSSGTKIKKSIQGQTVKSRRLSIQEDKDAEYRDYPRAHREHESWREMDYLRGPDVPDYGLSPRGGKRMRYALEEDMSYNDYRSYPRSRMDISYPVTSPSYGSYPHSGGGYDYYRRPSYEQYGMGPRYGGALEDPYQLPSYGRSENPPYRGGPYSR